METSKQKIQRQIKESLVYIHQTEAYTAISKFWNLLGYESDRQPTQHEYNYESFWESFGSGISIKEDYIQATQWKKLHLLFQITGTELTGYSQTEIFDKAGLDQSLLKSYLFATLELQAQSYSRSVLANIARQINRCFSIPLILTFRYNDTITIAVVDRRINKLDRQKDVLEKVTLIKDISLTNPHRAHLDILYDLSLPALREKETVNTFDELHKAWAKTLDLKELNKRFYKELSNWFFWAVRSVEFPDGEEENADIRNSISIIRLITRMFFVWFMKEKQLVPEALFDPTKIKDMLNFSDPAGSSYYKAILQNLFFATLNTEMNLSDPKNRRFREDIKGGTNSDFNNHNVYRYKDIFIAPEKTIAEYFLNIPFLNGGLFECLDNETKIDGRSSYIRIDGFSDRKDNKLKVPDELFFLSEEIELDLNDIYGTKGKRYKVRGLLSILHSYKFTVAENTPIEEEIALDPELLGRVFENLLASYNPETKATARHDTGSFYTPREVVDYMVDEALATYLLKALPTKDHKQKEDNDLRLRLLLTYSDEEHLFSDAEVNLLIAAIDQMKAIDPACGSGAFLMGLLLKMVYLLHKLDPGNEKWKAQQIFRLKEQIKSAKLITDVQVRNDIIQKLEASIIDVNTTFEDYDYDYSRKLFLIERCIFGVDIQPIAIQIAKLRFFLSLLVDEQKKDKRPNLGIRALPNLETKLVAADSLIRLKLQDQIEIFNMSLDSFLEDIKDIHNQHFTARNRKHKQDIRDQESKIRQAFAQNLISDGTDKDVAEKIARWNPYASNEHAEFFDPMVMFGEKEMNIVIANPPYIRQEDILNKTELKASGYDVYNSTSDLYTYFYELSLLLLAEGGVAAFITSNKWIRSKYGTKLRTLLKNTATLHSLIDFGGYQVFESATVDTNILVFEKNKAPLGHKLGFLNISNLYQGSDLNDYFYLHKSLLKQSSLEDRGWTLSDSHVLDLKAKIEAKGKPLKEWDIGIYYGIKTGCNEAFIIDTATKERLCTEDPKSIEIIKPILRGKDIHRYQYKWAGKWVIVIPSGWTNKNRGTEEAETYFKAMYPAVYQHFCQYMNVKTKGKGLVGRDDQGDFWWELRDCTYYDEFEKEKIVYPNMTKYQPFVIDQDGYYTNQKCYILLTKPEILFPLLALLNTRLMFFFIKLTFPELMGGTRELNKDRFELLPICEDIIGHTTLTDLAKEMQNIHSIDTKDRSSEMIQRVESINDEIDSIVFSLYGLSKQDSDFINTYGAK